MKTKKSYNVLYLLFEASFLSDTCFSNYINLKEKNERRRKA